MSINGNNNPVLIEFLEFVNTNIRPVASKYEAEGIFPRELIKLMGRNKYLAAPFPKKYGGLELNPVEYGHFTSILGKACNSARTLITVHTSLVGETILRIGNTEQKDKWIPLLATGEKIAAFGLTEPQSGSDAKSMTTTYKKEGDKFIIKGKKKWISFGDIADVFLVAAIGEKGISTFLVDRSFDGVSTSEIKGMMAGKATHLAKVEFDDVEVPKECLIGREGAGFEYVLNTALDYGRYSIAWAGVSIAEEAVEAITGYIRTRSQFGNKLYTFQLIQGLLADAITELNAAKALCCQAGELRRSGSEDAVMITNIAKYFSSKAAVKVSGDALQVYGANGFSSDYPVERLFREAKVLEVIEGSSQIQQQLIASDGLHKYYKSYHAYKG